MLDNWAISSNSNNNRIHRVSNNSTNKLLINRSIHSNKSRFSPLWLKEEKVHEIDDFKCMHRANKSQQLQPKVDKRNLVHFLISSRNLQVSSIILSKCHFRIILSSISLSIQIKMDILISLLVKKLSNINKEIKFQNNLKRHKDNILKISVSNKFETNFSNPRFLKLI